MNPSQPGSVCLSSEPQYSDSPSQNRKQPLACSRRRESVYFDTARSFCWIWYDRTQHLAAPTRACIWHDRSSVVVDSFVSLWSGSECRCEWPEIKAVSPFVWCPSGLSPWPHFVCILCTKPFDDIFVATWYATTHLQIILRCRSRALLANLTQLSQLCRNVFLMLSPGELWTDYSWMAVRRKRC